MAVYQTTDMARIIRAIAGSMHCSACPYPCISERLSSMSNCSRHWYGILMGMKKDPDDRKVMTDVMELYMGDAKAGRTQNEEVSSCVGKYPTDSELDER